GLNAWLQKAYDGSTVYAWDWYLVTPDYRAAPQSDPEGPKQGGTKVPIDPAFKSQYVGKGLEEVAQWLIEKPPSVDVDNRFFGVVDRQTGRSGKVNAIPDFSFSVPCQRLNDPKKEKEVAWCILKRAAESTLYLGGLDSSLDWNEDVQYGKYKIDV
ncbi:MAG: hypothetical protein Q9224_005701, partial [Gallowayella concinna]